MWLRASLSTAISLSVICALQSVNGAPLDETVKSISLPDVGQTKSPFDNLKGVSEEEADRFLLNRLSSSSNRRIGFDSASDEYYASPPSYRTGAYLRAGSKVIEHFNKGLDRQDWHPYARGFTEIEKLWNTHDYSDDEDEDWRRMLRAKRRRQFQKRLKKSGRKQADEGELESFLNRRPTGWEKFTRFLERLLTPEILVEVSKSEFLQQVVRRMIRGAKAHDL